MPSQKGKRAKVVQMTEQQPKTPQIIDIVEMPPTQNGPQTCKLTPSFVGTVPSFQNRKSTLLDPFHSLSFKYRFPPRARLKDGAVPTKEGLSLHLDQWKALCNMSDVIDDLLTRVIEKEPVEWRYHIGDKVYVCVYMLLLWGKRV
jgi:hypothetical protein